METEPAFRENTGILRNPDGTFPKGVSGNPAGKPKNTLKDYMRKKFYLMTDEEKEAFLSKISPEVQWKMGEGNPASESEITGSGGGALVINFDPSFKDNDTNS